MKLKNIEKAISLFSRKRDIETRLNNLKGDIYEIHISTVDKDSRASNGFFIKTSADLTTFDDAKDIDEIAEDLKERLIDYYTDTLNSINEQIKEL